MRAVAHSYKFTPEYYNLSQEVLDTALTQVAAYKAWQALDPGHRYSIDKRFAALPALTKKDIRENFPQAMLPADRDISRALASGEIALVETSGTTDDKITNIWNQKWWDASERSSWKLNSHMARAATGDHREAILVNAWNVGFVSDSIDLPMEKRRLSRFLYLNEKTNPTLWSNQLMERMVEELNIYQPAVLEANPSMLARLCRYISSRKKTVFQPEIIVFTYEYPAIFHYRQIRRVFPVPMTSSYGTTETGYVFMQCEEGKFHQNSDFCRVDFQPFRPEHGGPRLGRILATPFNNPWSYMVRFDSGDLACLEEAGKCFCGRNSGLILSSIVGRKANLTLTCSGRLVTLFELDNAISILEGIDEYGLIQLEASNYQLHLVSQREDKLKLSDEASELLRKLYGAKARIEVIFGEAILPENSGKYLLSKSLFPIELDNYLDDRYVFKKKSARNTHL
jgi:phenylacetate-coenzyme A ligase PaaK-like adenylate-forming protein